jgi:hypothetical protein
LKQEGAIIGSAFRVSKAGHIWLMLALLLGWGGASIAWGERITANGGDGWDGMLYRAIAERFPEPIEEVPAYTGRRCLPGVVVHYTLVAVNVPLSGPNILVTFRLYNLALYVVVLFALMAAADELGLGLRGKWLLFLFTFVNFANLKMYYFYSNLTDVWGLAFSTLALAAYLKRSTPGVLAATFVGSFAWPPLLPLTFGFILFPRRFGGETPVEPPARRMGNAVAATIAVATTAASAALAYGQDYFGPRPDTFELPALPLSLLLLAAFLFFGLRPLLDDAALYRWKTYCNRRTARGLILAVGCAVAGEVFFRQFAHLFPAQPQPMTPRIFVRLLLVLGVSKPLIFGVSHIAWFGVALIAVPFAWTAICRSAQRIGPGMTLALCGGVAIAIDSESRVVCGFYPAVALLAAKHFERRMVHPLQWVALIVLALAMSHVWLPLNPSPWPDGDHYVEFPMQALFMHIGPWMTTSSYAIQGAVIVAVGGPVIWAILFRTNRDPLRSTTPVPRGDFGSAFVASGAALVIGATLYASRLGWSDNPIEPILLTVGLSLFLVHFAYGARILLAQWWPVRDSWWVSDGALTFLGVILTAGAGAVIGPLAAVPIAICGAALLLLRMWTAFPFTPLMRLAFSAVCTVLLGLGLVALTGSENHHSPLFLEKLAAGTVPTDSLHQAASANMIRTYGVASTGLDGLPACRDPVGSPWLLAEYSTLLDMTVLDMVQVGYPIILLPLLVFAIGLAGTAFTGAGASAGRTPISWGVRTWVVVLVALVGWVPHGLGWYPAVSESYGIALVGLLLAVAAARPTLLRWREDPGSLSRADRIAAGVSFPLVVGALTVCKLSAGPILLAGAVYVFVRLGRIPANWRAWFSLGLCIPVVLALIPMLYDPASADARVWPDFLLLAWVAVAALLGALPSLPPLMAPSGTWRQRLGAQTSAKLALTAVVLTVLGAVAFRCISGGSEYATDNLRTRGFRGPPTTASEVPERGHTVEVERLLLAGKFGTARRSVRAKTVETEAKPDGKRDVLNSLDRLPLKDKRESILHIPKSTRPYWDFFPPEHPGHGVAGPLIGPAVSGLAMLEGLPDASPSAGYGYGAYPREGFAQRRDGDLMSHQAELCDRAGAMGFRRVIVMYLDSEGKPMLGEWPIGEVPAVLPPGR